MERAEVLTLLDTQRAHFNDTLDRVQRQCSNSIKDMEKKIADVITSLEYTQASLDNTTAKLNDAVKEKKSSR